MSKNNLKKVIFFSNSVPKSGSTLLFNMQKSFFESFLTSEERVAAKSAADALGDKVKSGFVEKPHESEFLDQISSNRWQCGPTVFKTHTLLNGSLRDFVIENEFVFCSMIVRDPVDVFLSAVDNHRKTGEFPEFSDFDSGVEIVNSYFRQILQSAINTSYKKFVPIIKYEEIISNPFKAMADSIPKDLWEEIQPVLVERHIDMGVVERRAMHRKNISDDDRRSSRAEYPRAAELEERLSSTREFFGYD